MPNTLSRQQYTVLILGLMATGIGQSLVFAILPPLGREVALSELQITSIIAVSALVFGIASPRWGRLSDRLGRKPIIITGLVGYTAGTFLFTSVFYAGLSGVLSGTALYVVLLIARCSQSVVMSATNPASAAYAADHSPPAQRTKTMARLGTANSMGTILGPAISGALATLGLLAPLYFAAALAAIAAVMVWQKLPVTPKPDLISRQVKIKVRYRDPRVIRYLGAAIGLFFGYSGIQQTLGFQLQDKMSLTGIETAQMTGAALMVAAIFTFITQMTAMQYLKLKPLQFIRLGMVSLLIGALFVANFDHFAVLAVGMGFLGMGLGMCMPAVSAGASLAVKPEEQGAIAGLVSSCPAIGFSVGPIFAGALYQIHGPLAPIFSACVFVIVLLVLTISKE
ncbi:MAG: MFS transporter [Halioglobus sp.]